MIITCPSCSTRYRRPAEAGESSINCSCSRCEAIFTSEPMPGDPVLTVGVRLDPEPAVPATPPVLPVWDPEPEGEVGLADLPIGMDDPTLASKVRDGSTERSVESAALTYTVLGGEELVEAVTAKPVKAVTAKPVKAVRPVPEVARPRKVARPGFFAFLVVTLFPTAMAAGAWQLSTLYGEDPMVWTASAGVLGLLFSWLWVRWKYRER